MEDLDKVKRALREVAQRYDMSDVHLNPQGAVGLELYDGQEVCLEYIADRRKLFIHTPLTAVITDTVKRQALLEAALQMNCLESGADGGVLALDFQRKTMLLQTALEVADLDAQRLDQALNRLLAQRDGMVQALTEAAGRTAGGNAAGRRAGGWAALAIQGGTHVYQK